MLKILQRYTLKEVIGPTFLSLLVFTFILLSTRIYRLLDLLLNWGADPLRMLALFSCLLPSLLSLTIPMALLAGVMIGCGRLAGEREIMAVRASGIGLERLIIPVLCLAALLSLSLLAFNINLLPQLIWKQEKLIYEIEFDILSHPKPRAVFDDISSGEEDSIKFTYQSRDPQDPSVLLGVALEFFAGATDPKSKTARYKVFLTAPRGTISAHPAEGLIRMTIFDGQALVLNTQQPDSIQLINYATLIKEFYPRSKQKKEPEHLSLSQLLQALASNPDAEKSVRGALKVELYNRLSIPLACLAFAWFGIPLALIVRPRGKAHSYSFTIGLIFFYYLLLHAGQSLGVDDSPLTGLVIFLPNLILFILGSVLLRKIIRT